MVVDEMMITHTCDTYTLRVHTATVHLRYTAGIMLILHIRVYAYICIHTPTTRTHLPGVVHAGSDTDTGTPIH